MKVTLAVALVGEKSWETALAAQGMCLDLSSCSLRGERAN